MATYESVMLAHELASAQAILRADDESVAFKIRGTDATLTTGKAVVGTAGTALTFTMDATVTTLDLASYATLGELVDHINATAGYYAEAVIVDGLRSQTSDNALLAGSYEYAADQVLATKSVVWDTDGTSTKHHTVALQHEGLPSTGDTDAGYMNRIYEIIQSVTDTTSTSKIDVYKCVGTVETKIYSRTAVIDVATETKYDLNAELGMDGGVGGRIVVVCSEQTEGGHIEIRGRSWKVA